MHTYFEKHGTNICNKQIQKIEAGAPQITLEKVTPMKLNNPIFSTTFLLIT